MRRHGQVGPDAIRALRPLMRAEEPLLTASLAQIWCCTAHPRQTRPFSASQVATSCQGELHLCSVPRPVRLLPTVDGWLARLGARLPLIDSRNLRLHPPGYPSCPLPSPGSESATGEASRNSSDRSSRASPRPLCEDAEARTGTWQHRPSPYVHEAHSDDEDARMLQTAQKARIRVVPEGTTPLFMPELGGAELKVEQGAGGRGDAASATLDTLKVLIERRKEELASLSASRPLQADASELQSQLSTSIANASDQQTCANSVVCGHQTFDASDQQLAHRSVGDENDGEYGATAELNLPNMIPAAILHLLLQEDQAIRLFFFPCHCVGVLMGWNTLKFDLRACQTKDGHDKSPK